ncbi:MAG: metallophosphoesterase [Verrucomicrobia bacterium]|nr:metallophosphoesterase [Verrucomicrobiota bacterium]MBU4274153.1 metallophosphoesterase [Planctomycetota bacterium]MBU4429379.1 metallophosphoesterase [Verrucomicrobiota bacterium]MCG2679663.1 metallophosphoesterase [Kiritimatiellia bacterium]
MRILAISDIDDFHWKGGSGSADVLLSCGDIIDQVILEAAEDFSCSTIFAVKGNHDSHTAFTCPIVDLHLQVCEHNGVTFGGLNGSWKYKPRGHFLYDQGEVDRWLASFPPVDVLLSHNSPRGIHDREDEVHYGFEALKDYVLRARPKIVVHGHQHMDAETLLGETRIIGIYGYKMVEI